MLGRFHFLTLLLLALLVLAPLSHSQSRQLVEFQLVVSEYGVDFQSWWDNSERIPSTCRARIGIRFYQGANERSRRGSPG